MQSSRDGIKFNRRRPPSGADGQLEPPEPSGLYTTYRDTTKEVAKIKVPDLKDQGIVSILADCWERTSTIEVPQYKDGEHEVRRLWDEATAEAMGRSPEELSELRELLHREPLVRQLGYNQYGHEKIDTENDETGT